MYENYSKLSLLLHDEVVFKASILRAVDNGAVVLTLRHSPLSSTAPVAEHRLLLHHREELLVVQVPRINTIYDEVVAIIVIVDREVHVALGVQQVHVPMLVHMLYQVVAL